MLSCTAIRASFFCKENSRTAGYSSEGGLFQIMVRGILPKFKKKGEYPVLADLAELIANSMAGNLATQSL